MSNTPGTGTADGGAPLTHQRSVWAIIVVGLILVALADYAPHLVNGLLVLILAGVVLKNSALWTPWVQSVSQSFSGQAG